MVPCILFSIFFGVCAAKYKKSTGSTIVLDVLKAANGIIIEIIKVVMNLAPIGIFCLLANVAGATGFKVVLPMLKPTLISVGILEIMWVWNDYLLPYLVLDRTKYMTIPIHIQFLKGSYGTVDLGATMALILLSIIPVIVFYLLCQKHIIKGVAAGAVKG
jgi:Na+/H+-dicarboxylate symporter